MTDSTQSTGIENSLSQNEMDYLIKELELHVTAENAARDNAEKMIQAYLTVLTAITGAVLLAVQTKADFVFSAFAISLGSLAILVFGIFTYIRMMGYRLAISIIRYRLYLIRSIFSSHGIRPANVIFSTVSKPDMDKGFSSRVMTFFVALSGFCGLMFSLSTVSLIVAMLSQAGDKVFDMYNFALYGFSAVIAFFVCFIFLLVLLMRSRENAERTWKTILN